MPIISRKGTLTFAVLIVGLLAIVALAMLKSTPKRTAREAKPPVTVDVVTVSPISVVAKIHSQGTVAPKREINLVSQVAGRIVLVADQYANGGFFKAGERLLQIEPQDYKFAVIRAEAQVAKAQEAFAMEQGRSRQAKREWRELGDKTANALFLRQPQLKSAQAALESAKADLNKAQLDLDRTGISAPFRGRIREIFVDLGQYVNPGVPVARVYSTNTVEIRLPLTDRQAALIDLPVNYQDNQAISYPSVTLRSNVGENTYEWQGKIVRTDASIDVKSRMTYAVAQVQNPFKSNQKNNRPPLNIGLFVEAEITGKEIPQAVIVPKDALYKGNQVLLLNENNEAYYHTIRVVQSDVDQVTTIGLTAGDRLVSSRIPLAITGMKVTPRVATFELDQNSIEGYLE
ncbi:MAG: efflux RND transporter periplasmic adaptor subunit [Porticoccaceae bacterium]|nr:efflux RND transporter periplasmic adaptor subunit [Porticoccaceae bacterium]MDG1475422.1 efflux RND transporter periplasmic adaptor subunit [Porticoccaceae bacterium]